MHDEMSERKQKNSDYETFIKAKECIPANQGFEVADHEINPILKPFQRACVRWALAGGCRALFEAFGLGKSVQQLEVIRLALKHLGGGRGIIVAPLGVRQEFARDAKMLGVDIKFVRTSTEVHGVLTDHSGIFITNYESIREGKIDLTLFDVISLDEASCLRSFGSKTFSEFLFGPVQRVPYRYVATATPSPNEYQELLAYAHFLAIMDIGQARTRFFKRNSEKSDDLTLHRHKEQEFWLWVASWALFLQKPSDLGFSDEGYELPELEIVFHELPVDHKSAPADKRGQGRLHRQAASGVSEASREKRDTLISRVAKMAEIVAESTDDHFLLWHDLEDERRAIVSAVPETVAVYGSQKLDVRERSIIDFSDGKIQYLAGKPQMLGSGCNFQRHCHRAIYVGIGYKFNDFIQSIHRLLRYLQTHKVRIDIIFAESEKAVLEILLEKWERDKEQRAIMTEIIQKYGLAQDSMRAELTRGFGVEREAITGELFEVVHNDAVVECRAREENSIDLILTSIPFATQYEYSPNYNDFGHTDDNEHFFAQMDFLTPELYRVLKPGRVAAIHVKDRIVPSGMSGLGFQIVYPFHADCIAHYQKHGFFFMGMATVVTDVVRENNQTYRLSYTEQCKDGTKHGFGMPEYVLYFRKPPSETSNAYADQPVVKSKDDYSLGRWQLDAHGYMRSSGERLLTPEEIISLPWKTIYRLFKQYSLNEVYDYEKHVDLCTALRDAGRLPVDFMLLPPQSAHPDVWTDITRMRSLNSSQAQKGRQMHLCPLQFDICDRVIAQKSMPGEVVLDPFGGLMTVPVRAVRLGRRGIGIELNRNYYLDGAAYCQAAEMKALSPTLFDLAELESEPVEEFREVAA
jgi:DNA modification methylase